MQRRCSLELKPDSNLVGVPNQGECVPGSEQLTWTNTNTNTASVGTERETLVPRNDSRTFKQ
jgi:hypothetical protein